MKTKTIFILIIFLIAVVLGSGVYYFFSQTRNKEVFCTMEAKECSDGSFVSRVPPDCEFSPCPGEEEGILISSPKINEKIKNPLKIKGEARGFWFFEAQFTAELYDAEENFLGRAILTAKDDWMTEDIVPFEGELNFTLPSTSSGALQFLSDNPSGLPENQKIFTVPIEFTDVSYRKVLLYYYNPENDKDESGNTKCSRDGLVAIERKILTTKTPIQDTIKLLLEGKENLTEEDINRGITTEYPLEGLSLAEVNLKEDGTLILRFNDPLSKTSGGSCRTGILWFQIEATAKQFPEVKKTQFLPEELFQP